MRLNKFLSFYLISLLVGCTSIKGDASNSSSVVIRDHFMSGSGYAEVMNQAKTYCRQYGANAILRNKKDGCFLLCGSEYSYYNFDCVKAQTLSPLHQPSYKTPAPSVSLDEAKDKCSSLGLKTGTESFGKCVLQLSK